MLERLFASIMSGPSLNCRPHNSRQRVDLSQLAKFGDVSPDIVLRALLTEEASATVLAKHVAPPSANTGERFGKRKKAEEVVGNESDAAALAGEALKSADLSGGESGPKANEADTPDARKRAWSEQSALLGKLRLLVDEAKTYEDDTGVYVLNLGYPLLSLPPGSVGGGFGTRRVLAPIAFIPVSLTVKAGASPSIELACKEGEVDRVMPNEALLAWLEQQTGKAQPANLFEDDEGVAPWKEICGIVAHVCSALNVATPEAFAVGELPASVPVVASPRADDAPEKPTVVPAAVLGLFPMANEGLLRDTQALAGAASHPGPIEAFVKAGVSFDEPPKTEETQEHSVPRNVAGMVRERLVARADPCQARAVALARTARGLVIHGPPGTGKSQTITNIIGDHLSRGERVLFVCEKRTALDVVANRLEGLGLSGLCAVIHDPQRDQKDLYMAIRSQLETLTEVVTHPRAAEQVAKMEAERATIHAELTAVHDSLMGSGRGEGDGSISRLVGEWIETLGHRSGDQTAAEIDEAALSQVPVADPELLGVEITNLVNRANDVDYPGNGWKAAAGISVDALVSQSMDGVRARLGALVQAAEQADRTLGAGAAGGSSDFGFDSEVDLKAEAAKRESFAAEIETLVREVPASVRSHWMNKDAAAVERGRREVTSVMPVVDAVLGTQADRELLSVLSSDVPNSASVATRLAALQDWLPASKAWWGFVAFGKKAAAANVLKPLGLPVETASAERAIGLYSWIRSGLQVRNVLDQLMGRPFDRALPTVEDAESVRAHGRVLAVLSKADGKSFDRVRLAVGTGDAGAVLVGLRAAGPRANALGVLEAAAAKVGVFNSGWLTTKRAEWRAGGRAAEIARELQSGVESLEGVIRVREALQALNPVIAEAVGALVEERAAPETASRRVLRCVLAGELARRITADPRLRGLDSVRMEELFTRSRELSTRLQEKVRDATIHLWTDRQKTRLLASTLSKMNSLGATTRQRLTTRGKNAMRLRQVLALGRNTEGGDPLMDLRPVWMASPETVAQIFPREPVFDVVIFDEASQCRLEEALPVLTRAKRVVIAGDPKQLPPTRFFESTVAQSEAVTIANDEELFEAQQSEVEDLLTGALSLDIEQSYLDVHYRSHNSDLIEFSNEHFYGSRLQAIPGHPSRRAILPPLTLYAASGTYEDRTNEKEALQVVRIIRDLLKRAEPPSIGVGCFNIAQRDLITEKLDELAAEDAAFARALAGARERRNNGAYEGLFVKNLENVQGDERDHIIISTTYGPDVNGKFYRRFGPLAMPGGGRRLNVLVTRARIEVHLVTSIPREVYTALPPVPEGSTPGGGWLLFAYLKFAEDLAEAYKQQSEARDVEDSGVGGEGAAFLPPIDTVIASSKAPSSFAMQLGTALHDAKGIGSIVHWGNEGFCVDVAVRHPKRAEDVTVGVLCDFARFGLAPDPVEWDIFRTGVLTASGWTLKRVWSPVFFRDAAGQTEIIVRAALEAAKR